MRGKKAIPFYSSSGVFKGKKRGERGEKGERISLSFFRPLGHIQGRREEGRRALISVHAQERREAEKERGGKGKRKEGRRHHR